jgi:uncharacterized protein
MDVKETVGQGDTAVTVVATRLVKVGKELAYEQWLRELIAEASVLPGYLGTNVQRPAADGDRQYTSVFRFDSISALRNFENSDLRARALSRAHSLVESDAVWKTMSGLEFWFSPPPGTVVPQPSRWRMALVMIAVVYLLVFSIGSAVALIGGGLPMPIRLLLTITIEVFLMTFVIMPRLTKLLARWIYPSTTKKGV